MNLPNLIIAGVNKAGTTSLFSYLSLHPDVGVSDVKETCFFLPVRYGEDLPSIENYASHFSEVDEKKYVMESTPGYFYGGLRLAKHIDSTLPNVKIIIMLRDPVDRLISFYRYKKAMLELDGNMGFSEYLDQCYAMDEKELEDRNNNKWFGVQGGVYSRHLEAWLNVFGDRISVVFFDDLKKDAVSFVKNICKWLSIDESVYDNIELSVENRTLPFRMKSLQRVAIWLNDKGERIFRRNPGVKKALRNIYQSINTSNKNEIIDQAQRASVHRYYDRHNKELSELLRRHGYTDLPQWLK